MFWISMALSMMQPGATDAALDAAEAAEDATRTPEAPTTPTDLEAVKYAVDAWKACTIREADPMIRKTEERADAIVTAAMSFCWREEKSMRAATEIYLEGQFGSDEAAPSAIRAMKDAWRTIMVSAAIKMRSQ